MARVPPTNHTVLATVRCGAPGCKSNKVGTIECTPDGRVGTRQFLRANLTAGTGWTEIEQWYWFLADNFVCRHHGEVVADRADMQAQIDRALSGGTTTKIVAR